jgi:hypothetical protein
MSETIAENITWNPALEKYFADTGEKAHCLSWLHKRAEAVYSYRKTWIDLPVIVISGVIGFLSAGSTSMFNDPQTSSIALGVASLFVSILNTAGSYFGWAKRAEGHRISAIHYSKLYRFLSIEMSLPREERMTPADLLKLTRDGYDRLQEISPMIPPEVLREFKKKFETEKEIAKPEEANGLEHIIIFSEPTDDRRPSFLVRPEVLIDGLNTTPEGLSPTLPTEVETHTEPHVHEPPHLHQAEQETNVSASS